MPGPTVTGADFMHDLDASGDSELSIGSLFSGYGGLDLAVEHVFNAKTVWFSELNQPVARVFAHHWPEAPNLGDTQASSNRARMARVRSSWGTRSLVRLMHRSCRHKNKQSRLFVNEPRLPARFEGRRAQRSGTKKRPTASARECARKSSASSRRCWVRTKVCGSFMNAVNSNPKPSSGSKA